MPNGKIMLNELEFEKRINGMEDRQLLEFVARQNYETCLRCDQHDRRLKALESQSRRLSSIAGGIMGTVAGIIVGIINYFVSK